MNVLNIAGCIFEVRTPEVGEARTFPGAGLVMASAIERVSKNNYRVVIIIDDNVFYCEKTDSLRESISELQLGYDKFGKIGGAA